MLTTIYAPHFLSHPLLQFFSETQGKEVKTMVEGFPHRWRIYIVGGLLRDLAIGITWGTAPNIADIDLVVEGANSREELFSHLQECFVQWNDFGGVKGRTVSQGLPFDIWRIEDHINLNKKGPPFNIDKLLHHFLVDVDALAWDVETETLFDYGAIGAIKSKRIELIGFDGVSEAFQELQASHIVAIAIKTGFIVSGNAIKFVRHVCEKSGENRLIEMIERKVDGEKRTIDVLVRRVLESGSAGISDVGARR